MSTPPRAGQGAGTHEVPHSYAEIVRETVVLPDGSHRPSLAEEEAALRRQPRPISPRPSMMSMKWALAQLEDVDRRDVAVAVADAVVTVTGVVATRADRERIVLALEAVPGVAQVNDELRIRAG